LVPFKFGFDRNDLNLDHFTENIIRVELASITAVPVPDPAKWIFKEDNDGVFAKHRDDNAAKLAPELWVSQGPGKITQQLASSVDYLVEELKPKKQKQKKKMANDGHHPDAAVGHTVAGLMGAAGAAGGAADATAIVVEDE
jgi:hypothetical protein